MADTYLRMELQNLEDEMQVLADRVSGRTTYRRQVNALRSRLASIEAHLGINRFITA